MKKKKIYIFVLLLLISVYIPHIKTNAYVANNSVVQYRFHWSRSDNANARIAGIDWNANGASDSRSILLYSPSVEQMAREYYGDNYFITHTQDYNFILSYKGSLNYVPICNHMSANVFIQSPAVREAMGITEQQAQYISCEIVPIKYNNSGENITETNNYHSVNYNGESHEDWQFVTSLQDAKSYLIDGDNSVVIEGDPANPPVTQDNMLPVPQSLTCDLHNSYTASNPYIEGSWENPKNASWDAIKNDVKIHIQYKPKFQFYKRFLSVKDGQRSAHQYIELGKVNNENKNIWINAFPNTPAVAENVIKFESLQQDMIDVSRMVGAGEIFYSGGATLLNGTKWRVRYELPDGRVSYWAVYGVNSIGDVKSSDTVTFQDNEDNVVSSDAVNYKNSWQTDPNNYNPDTINNSLLSRLRQALNDIQSLPSDMNSVANEGSSFANFLKMVWEKFPEIYILFIGGLIIAIILRILGR